MVEHIHATAIAVAGCAVLVRGPSGSGKSDLALRCLALGPGPFAPAPALLVADDQVLVEVRDGALAVRCPVAIAGLLEVRGVGIVRVDHVDNARLALVADLTRFDLIERLPEAGERTAICGIALPLVRIDPFQVSAPIKLLLALAAASREVKGDC